MAKHYRSDQSRVFKNPNRNDILLYGPVVIN